MQASVRSKLCAGITYKIVRTITSPYWPILRLHLDLCMPQTRYNKLCGSLRSLAHRIALFPSQDPFRSRMEGQVLSKLYDMGVLNSQAKLSDVDNKLTVAAFCRRRLAVIMVTSKMAETVSAVSTVFLVDGMCQAHPKSGGQIY
jgi:U3 small nucleolar ribonucleoprotein protein IMP3